MSTKPFFLTFEGTDGVGKTTQIKLLTRWLRTQKILIQLTREPGGGRLAEKIRKVLLDPKIKIDGLSELFLYEAARIDHVKRIILPALKAGKMVLCDRFTDATLAYQGAARNLPYSLIHKLNKIATGGLKPDLTILLDLPARTGLKRARQKKKGKDRLENEGFAFQERVRKGYLKTAKAEPHRIKRVQVQDSIMGTQNIIRKIIRRKLDPR